MSIIGNRLSISADGGYMELNFDEHCYEAFKIESDDATIE